MKVLNMGNDFKVLDWNNPKLQYSISHRNQSFNEYAFNSFNQLVIFYDYKIGKWNAIFLLI